MELRPLMEEAVRSAGRIIRENFNTDITATLKDGGKSIVTKVDGECEEVIISLLNKHTSYKILAEESGLSGTDSEYKWIIDPLDGTTNFSRGIPFFCVSLGLFKGNVPEKAAIYAPLTDELFYAEKGGGAYLNGQPLRSAPASKYVVAGFEKIMTDARIAVAVQKMSNLCSTGKSYGSTALDLAYVASGKLDCCLLAGSSLWDVAAGVLIAEESGYAVTNWKGEPWTPNQPILVCKKELHARIVDALR